jgi:uncharacterized protein (TIGR03067 family)
MRIHSLLITLEAKLPLLVEFFGPLHQVLLRTEAALRVILLPSGPAVVAGALRRSAQWSFLMSLRNSILLLCCLAFAYGEVRAGEAEEQVKLEGTWSFVSSSGGANQKKENHPAMRMAFKGDTVSFVAEDNKRTVQGTYTVSLSKSPKTMDITLVNNGKKLTTLAIYELDGDTLKLCHFLGGMASKERPTEFVADKQTVLGILNREKR